MLCCVDEELLIGRIFLKVEGREGIVLLGGCQRAVGVCRKYELVNLD